jgi:hypothetical protein
MPIQLEAAGGVVSLQGADAETAVRKAGGGVTGPDAGLLTRLNAGTASARVAGGETVLAVNSVNLAGAGSVKPASLDALPPIRITPGPAATLAGLPPLAGSTGPARAPSPAPSPAVATLANTFPSVKVGTSATFTPTLGTAPLTVSSRPPVTAGTAVNILVNAGVAATEKTTTINVGGVSGTVTPRSFSNNVAAVPGAAAPVAPATTAFVPTTSLATGSFVAPANATVFVPRTTITAPTANPSFTGNVLQFRR